ncbi:MAG: PglZ domain-containing protein, partial [Synergistaceae bacterium]|nr:PglZ domain-containing protein [Synergistaceae bacterium]
MREESQKAANFMNLCYQKMIFAEYPSWVAKDAPDIRLTCQFLRRCVKPYWDMEHERAVVFVFDGMRYDIWDEMVRPLFIERMDLVKDYPAVSLLPTETHISRKSIFAGTFPDSFDRSRGEDALLKETMQKEFGYTGQVEVLSPEDAGTGETVRYRAGNIDFYIFEICDKELHKIPVKTLPDGRVVPGRPLAFIYQQHIKDIIDREVMTIVR